MSFRRSLPKWWTSCLPHSLPSRLPSLSARLISPAANVRAMLIDEAFFQVYDDLFLFKSWENPKSLYNNYYLHVWQTLAYSILVNAVAFEVPAAG